MARRNWVMDKSPIMTNGRKTSSIGRRKDDDNYSAKLDDYIALDGLRPRPILPRNLRQGIYRGGRRPIDIFWRVQNGIDGTPMPAANKAALQEDDLWDIVNYVLSLPYEPASRPGGGFGHQQARSQLRPVR